MIDVYNTLTYILLNQNMLGLLPISLAFIGKLIIISVSNTPPVSLRLLPYG